MSRDELLANVAEALHDGGDYRALRDQIDAYASGGHAAPPVVWLVLVPSGCDCGVVLPPDHVRSVHASEAAANAEAARINRVEGRRSEEVQAWVDQREVLP